MTGENQFLYFAGHSLLREMYIFGGKHNSKQIAKLSACIFEDTGKRLLSSFYGDRGSLAALQENSEKIILCNGADTRCEIYDGDKTVSIQSTKNKHDRACMSINEHGRPTIIAGYHTSSAEILEISGWQNSQPHPAGQMYRHACTAVSNGIITVGGSVNEVNTKNVYLFRNELWSIVGQMKNVQNYATVGSYDTFFNVFGGIYSHNSVERAEWDGDKITSTRVINNHDVNVKFFRIFNSVISGFGVHFDTRVLWSLICSKKSIWKVTK